MLDSPIEKKKKITQVYEYSKDWTAHDFYGKYHINRIKNPVPVPGTQIQVEYDHIQKKNADLKRYEDARESKKLEIQKTLELKKKSTEVEHFTPLSNDLDSLRQKFIFIP